MVRLRTRQQLSSPLKNRIVGFIQATKSVAKASQYYHKPYSTCHDLKLKFEATHSTHNLPRSGRPHTLSPRGERRLTRAALKDDSLPVSQVAKEFSPKMSRSTVHRILKRRKVNRRLRRRVPYISPKTRKIRVAFAHGHKAWDVADWAGIIFSDEAYIVLGGSAASRYVTRRAGEEFAPGKTMPMFKQSPVKVMVWACIGLGMKGPITVIDFVGGKGGGVNASCYQEQVLDSVLLPFLDSLGPNGYDYVFQQDNAPCHTAKSTKEWFASAGIELFPHPPSSPDCNPIENVWFLLKSEIQKRRHMPTSVNELKEAIYEAWENLRQEDIDACILAMPRRMKEIIKQRGGNIKA